MQGHFYNVGSVEYPAMKSIGSIKSGGDPLAKAADLYKRIRSICLSFPDAVETETWGKPHFRVNNKIFAGCGEEDGKIVLGFKLEMEHAKQVIKIPGFWKAPYVGHKGWVSMDVTDVKDWELVREMVLESFRLIAPVKSSKKLPGAFAEESDAAKKPRKKK
jgi:predicted DNA-binding protein (MmcQ/YjbR family)